LSENSNRSAMIAAAIILVGAGIVLYLMPMIVLSLAEISPWLATVVGICIIMAFFLVFWLRARYQRRRR
jgi:hypothetical protein